MTDIDLPKLISSLREAFNGEREAKRRGFTRTQIEVHLESRVKAALARAGVNVQMVPGTATVDSSDLAR